MQPKSFKDIVKNRVIEKPPAYEWQDLALRIITELNIPNNSAAPFLCAKMPNHRKKLERYQGTLQER